MLVARLDDIVQRIVRTMFARGLIDNSQPREEAHKINMAAHAKISRADAEEGMVLLKEPACPAAAGAWGENSSGHRRACGCRVRADKVQAAVRFRARLSYTTFGYSALAARADRGSIVVDFNVHNSGKGAGDAAPQVYVAPAAGGWEALNAWADGTSWR